MAVITLCKGWSFLTSVCETTLNPTISSVKKIGSISTVNMRPRVSMYARLNVVPYLIVNVHSHPDME